MSFVQSTSASGSAFWGGFVSADVYTHVDGVISGNVSFKLTTDEALEFAKKLISACADVKARESREVEVA